MAAAALGPMDEFAVELAGVRTETGRSLLGLVEESPVLLVFIRHFGCPFGRKAIEDVAQLRGELAVRGVRPVFVHLGTPEMAKTYFDYYGLNDVERVSDPEAKLYGSPAFALGKRNPWVDLVNPVVWAGWLRKNTLAKYGMGKFEGDGTQMPGIFFLKGARIVRQFRYKSIADEPDYLKLVG